MQWCDKSDCPVYIDNKRPKILKAEELEMIRENREEFKKAVNIIMKKRMGQIKEREYKRIKLGNYEIPEFCLLCTHFKKCDMRSLLLAEKAEEILKR